MISKYQYFYHMRRKEQEIKELTQIEKIIKEASVCRLCMADLEFPYIIPLCFGYRDKILYFHSASEGKKIELLKKNNKVSFEIDIPGKIIEKKKHCNWDIEYQSVIGYGIAEFVKNLEQKKAALNIILNQYSNPPFNTSDKNIHNTTIIKLNIINMTGKKS